MIRLGCAVAPALLVPLQEARTQAIDFKAEVVKPAAQSMPVWPFEIVSFTSAAILPISDLCIADCKTMTIKGEGGAGEPFEFVTIKGKRAAIVASRNTRQQFTVCDGLRASCMRYTVLRASQGGLKGAGKGELKGAGQGGLKGAGQRVTQTERR